MEKKKTNYLLNKKRHHGTTPPSLPTTGAQLIIVTDNANHEGKKDIKVKLQWQQDRNKSMNWIRVQTPDGGTSSKGTKRLTFVSEKEGQIIIGVEYSSSDRLYVMDSVFFGENWEERSIAKINWFTDPQNLMEDAFSR